MSSYDETTKFADCTRGRKERVAVRAESTLGDTFTSTSGFNNATEFRLTSANFTEDQEHLMDESKRPTMTKPGFFDGNRTAGFTLEGFLRPSGTNGSISGMADAILLDSFGFVPKVHVIGTITGTLQSGETLTGGTSGASGTITGGTLTGSGDVELDPNAGFVIGETATGGTSSATIVVSDVYIKWTIDESHTSLGFIRDVETIGETLGGAYITAFEVTFDGSGGVRRTVEGIAQKKAVVTAGSTLNGAVTSGNSQFTLQAGGAFIYEVGGFVQTESDAGSSNTGFRITAKDTSANTVDVSPNTTTTSANGERLGPIFPACTAPSGPIIPGTKGSVSIDGTTYAVISGRVRIEVELDTNVDNFGSEVYDKVCTMSRMVTWEVTLRAYRDAQGPLLKSRSGATSTAAVIITVGEADSSAVDEARLFKFTMPTSELGAVTEIDVPDQPTVQYTVGGTAIGSAAGSDELTITME